jgi:hypothetical protein
MSGSNYRPESRHCWPLTIRRADLRADRRFRYLNALPPIAASHECLKRVNSDVIMRLADNRAWYDHLVTLAAHLREHGANAMADSVSSAPRQAAGLSTEFPGESRLALRKLRDSSLITLSDKDRADLTDVLAQLDVALYGKRKRREAAVRHRRLRVNSRPRRPLNRIPPRWECPRLGTHSHPIYRNTRVRRCVRFVGQHTVTTSNGFALEGRPSRAQ